MKIVNDRAMLQLMHVNDTESLFNIVEGNKEIWTYLIAKMDSYQDMEQYVQVAIKGFEGDTDLRNEKAQRAIERLGAVKEGVLRNERQLPNGYVRDAVVYSIIASEWTVIKEQLLQKLAVYK